MTTPSYGFAKTLPTTAFADAVTKVTDALAAEGFGILSTIDVSATLKKKLDADVRPYTILGACNPTLANKALAAEPHIGLLLPCNVLVQGAEDGKGSTVSILDPRAMMLMTNNAALNEVAADAEARLKRVMAAL